MLVDLKGTYHKPIGKDLPVDTPAVENYSGSLTDELLFLALASGHQSRFKKEALLKPFFEVLYTQWIKNALESTMTDAIFVHLNKKRITGFVTLKKNASMGEIGLIAVNVQERGKGIGRQLLQAADNWFKKNNLKIAKW